MRRLYPPIKPHRKGFLCVSEVHEIYFEECGNPDGKPAVFLHGGPGGGTEPKMRRFFDPARYRIVLFDQRGIWSTTSSACGSIFTSSAGWYSAAPGGPRWRSRTPRSTPSG
jgi:proline iminopeptidase